MQKGSAEGWVETHIPCPRCSSSDGYSISTSGFGKCFSCGININEWAEGSPQQPTKRRKPTVGKKLIEGGEFQPLRKRKITEDTCKKFGYRVAQDDQGRTVQVAPYRDQSEQVAAQKIRGANKKFYTTGDFDIENLQLFGQHLWQSGGKRIVVVEGEIDAMSLSQAQGNKWPVVSIPSGAGNFADPIKTNIEWLHSFDEVIFCFDMDDAGQDNVRLAAELMKPGKAKIAILPEKDASEMLQQGRGADLVACMWNAHEFRPDGLVGIDDILEELSKPVEWGLPWFLPSLTRYTYGRRRGEVYGFGAGTGAGKTDLFTQQMEYDINTLDEGVGVIYLEQKPAETATRIAGKAAKKQFHIPDGDWTQADKDVEIQKLKGKVTFYDSWGNAEWERVENKIRYMAAKGVYLFYVDHLTAMADPAKEKESLEQIMKSMAGLTQELNIIVHFISHLATPEGKPHEEGGRVMIRHFKGSRAIGFWCFFMFGLEGDLQSDEPRVLRCLKDRYTGQATGKTILLGYDVKTGTLSEQQSEEQTAEDHGFEPDF